MHRLLHKNSEYCCLHPHIHVESIAEFVDAVFLAVPDKTCHDSQNVIVSYSSFMGYAVVAKNDVILIPHVNNSVKHVIFPSPEKYYISNLAAFRIFLSDDEHIPSLTQKRQHTSPLVGVNELSVIGQVPLNAHQVHSPHAEVITLS